MTLFSNGIQEVRPPRPLLKSFIWYDDGKREPRLIEIIVSYVCSDSLMLRDTLEFLFNLSN